MKKLEEEFQLEKRYLERKFEILKEYGSETSSVTEENEEDKLSKIEEWLAGTERHGDAEDSGLVAEAANEQTPNNLDRLEEHHALNAQQNPIPSILRTSQQNQHRQSFIPTSSLHNQRPPQNVHYSTQPLFVQNEHLRSESNPLQMTFQQLHRHGQSRMVSLPGTQCSRNPQSRQSTNLFRINDQRR